MYYIKVDQDGSVSDYTIEQLFIDYPDADIYKAKSPNQPNKFKLRNYGVYELEVLPKPTDPNFNYTPDIPVKDEFGNWIKGWIPVQKTEEELFSEKKQTFERVQRSEDGELFDWDLHKLKQYMGEKTIEAINNGVEPPTIQEMFEFKGT